MAEKQVSVRIKAEGAGQVKAEFQSIGSEAQKSFGNIDRGARGGGQALQNVGFQVQDFAVQVAGGTDVSRAFAQQLPQLLSGLGLVGVLFGTVAAVAIPLFAAFGMGADKAKELEESVKTLGTAMSALRSASQAAAAKPVELFGDFGAGFEQAKEVLAIQREIAAARAENALDQAAGSIAGFLGNDAERIDAYRQKIKELQNDLAAVRANPPLAADFDFSQAEADIAKLQGRLEKMQSEAVENLAYGMDVTAESATKIVEALGAVGEASGPRAQAEAMSALRDALVAAAQESGVMSDELLAVLQNLTDAELAALGLAAVDIAGPISAAVGPASALAANLWDAAAAQSAFNRANSEYGKVDARGDPREYMPGGAKPFTPSAEVIKAADEMLNPRPRRGGGGGGGGGVSEADREAKRIYDQTRTAAEKYAIELEKLNALHEAGKLDTDTYSRALEKLGKDLDKTEGLGKKAASAIRGAFDNLFDDPAQALKDLSKQLFQMALYAQLAKSMPNIFGSNGIIPLMNANGNVFDAGQVQAFAAGGIVSSATMFPMKGGLGVMGEAGPEAIMPLTRVGGKLGVAAAGGGGGVLVKNEVHNYSGAPVTQSEGRGPKGETIIRTIVGKQIADGSHDGPMRSRFGNRPNPMKR
jgi:hypothetical protein